MAYEVRWAESAILSLIDAIEFIARDSPVHAAAFAAEAERVADSLQALPARGRRVPEFKDPAVRELNVTSHRMFYRVGRTHVTILAFIHRARDLGALFPEHTQ